MSQILLGDEAIEFTTRISKRAKRISIRCNPNGMFEIVYPAENCAIAPEEILRMKRAWVLRQRRAFRDGTQEPFVPRRYVDGALLPFLGEDLRLRLIQTPGKSTSAHRRESRIEVTLPRHAFKATKTPSKARSSNSIGDKRNPIFRSGPAGWPNDSALNTTAFASRTRRRAGAVARQSAISTSTCG